MIAVTGIDGDATAAAKRLDRFTSAPDVWKWMAHGNGRGAMQPSG